MKPIDTLKSARKIWESGDLLANQLVDRALAEVAAIIRIRVRECLLSGAHSTDPTEIEKGWHRGPLVREAAATFIKLYPQLMRHLKLLEGHVDAFPLYSYSTEETNTIFNASEVCPWSVYGLDVPHRLFGTGICSVEELTARIARYIELIYDGRESICQNVLLMQHNSRRWQEWFQLQQTTEANSKEEFYVSDVCRLTGYKNDRVRSYAKSAGVRTPGVGDRQFRWTHDEVIVILREMQSSRIAQDKRKQVDQALAELVSSSNSVET